MSQSITVSKLINEIGFKLNQSEYRKAQDKIKRMAGLWTKTTNQMTKSMESGKRIANAQTKAIDRQSRAELKAYRTRQQTIRADQIKFAEQIKNNKQFQNGLQRINSAFLQGTTSFKERSAAIGALHKQYKALNQSAGHYNKVSGIAGRVGTGVRGAASTGVGLAATGAGVVGAAGYAMHQGYESVKGTGQGFEKLLIGLTNTFGADRAGAISNQIRAMSDEMGQPVLQLGEQLTNYVSIVKALGIETNKAIDMFKKQSNMTASYGMSQDQIAGFQYGLTQTMSSNTLEDFKQTMDWSPQIKTDLLAFVKKTMGISQKEFMGNLTNGKYDFKQVWLKFVEDSAAKYAQMSSLYKNSSMANDQRAGNSVSLAIYRIFSSSGFKEALKYTTQLLNRWGSFLESNAKQVGEIFGNLYKVVGELAEQGLSKLTDFLKDLTADDIRTFFNDLKKGLQDFGFVISALADFIRKFIPDEYIPVPRDQAQQNYKAQQEQTQNWRSGSTYAPGMQLQIPTVPTIKVPSFADNYISRKNQTAYPQSNFSGTLDLKVNAEVNELGFSKFVDFKIEDNNTKTINMVTGGY